MLIYADHEQDAEGAALLDDTRASLESLADAGGASHDRLVSALIDLGAFESGVADALCATADDGHWVLDALRRASEAMGLAVAASWRGMDQAAAGVRTAAAAIGALPRRAMPSHVRLRTPEGYAFYALYPEAYAEAAVEWASARRTACVQCVGLRTIGTSLSAIVHGALTLSGVRAESCTLRPRGHPFARRMAIGPELARRWNWQHDVFLVVDEGPGLSGSSLTGAAEALSALGVPDDRIVLMAAWDPAPEQLQSASARARWMRHARVVTSFDRVKPRVLGALGLDTARDVSAGRWRPVLRCPRPWPPAHPQHERLKLLAPDGRFVRFAGLGRHGEEHVARAGRLADAGWSPRPLALRSGLLTLHFEPGTPLASYGGEPGSLDRAAGYAGWLRRHEATGALAPVDPLAHMLLVNAREGLGEAAAAAAERLIGGAQRFAEPAVALDARLLPHEWVRTARGLIKSDALDHGRDHFLPGRADAAWDVAGLIVEAGLTGAACAACVATYVHASGDAHVAHRLPFYVAAYAAFRMGYCAMAEPSVDTAERRRFARARVRYADALRAALA